MHFREKTFWKTTATILSNILKEPYIIATPKGVLDGSSMLILHAPKRSAKQNVKMSFLFQKYYSYISLKKPKLTKWDQQKN